MKAHYDGLTCRQKKIITDVAVRTATRLADQQKEAIAIRSQYLVFVAMLSLVKDKYAHYQEDDLADYVFYQHLQDHGVHVKKTAEVDFSPLQPSKGKGSSAPKAPKKQTEEQKK